MTRSMTAVRGTWVAIAIMFCPTFVAGQQSGTIQGMVHEEGTQRPLSMIQVFIPETGLGTLTNTSGAFQLVNVPAGQVQVRAQGVGYGTATQTITVAAGETVEIEFALNPSAIALDEVVITGTGQATERKRLGNSIATVNVAEELENAPIRDLSEVLQGREPGVVITQSGGIAGEGSRIRIRGSSSLSQSNDPLIYVDGIRIDNSTGFGGAGSASRLNDINPNSIARIEVLKGAAAATLYGTEASNGVIQIFTKRGQEGKPKWTAEIEQGFSKQDESRYEPLAGFVLAQEPASRLGSQDIGVVGVRDFWGIDVEPYEVFRVPLAPIIFETGRHQTSGLSVSGGNDLLNYYVSGRLADENGTFGATQHGPAVDVDTKKQANVNLSLVPLEDVRLQLSTRYMEGHHAVPTNGNSIFGAFSLTVMSKPEFARPENPTGAYAFSALPEIMQILEDEDVSRFGGALTASYTPLPGLSVETTFGVDQYNTLGVAFRRFGWNVSGISGSNPQGDKTVESVSNRELTFDSRASWNTDLGDQFSSGFVVGAQLLSSNYHETQATGEQFPAPGLEVAGAGANQSVFEFIREEVSAGVFAQEQIGFRDYLFGTFGVRYDQHSAFGSSAGGVIYPKVSVSLIPSDMPAWGETDLISTFRVRAALGQSGLQPGAYDKFTTFEPLPSEMGPGVEPDNLGNPDLKPEVSTEWEAGAELGLFNDRIALQGSYWNRQTDDVLVARQFPPSGGFVSTQLDNLGEMKAWGVELGANGSVYSSRNFSLNLFANLSYLQQEVTDMGGAPPIKVGYYRYRTWIKEGYAPGAYFGPKLADAPYPFDTNGDGTADTRDQLLTYLSESRSPDDLALLLADEDGDGDFLDHFLGSPFPDWQGAFGGDITFLENFQLNSLFEYRAGHVVHNLSGAFRSTHTVLGRNTPVIAEVESTLLNPASTAEERLDAAMIWSREGADLAPSNALNAVEPGDFIRWRELSLTYNVPTSLVSGFGAETLQLTASARNLMLWTKYSGIDPESNVVTGSDGENNFLVGIDGWRPGAPRRFSLSARVSF